MSRKPQQSPEPSAEPSAEPKVSVDPTAGLRIVENVREALHGWTGLVGDKGPIRRAAEDFATLRISCKTKNGQLDVRGRSPDYRAATTKVFAAVYGLTDKELAAYRATPDVESFERTLRNHMVRVIDAWADSDRPDADAIAQALIDTMPVRKEPVESTTSDTDADGPTPRTEVTLVDLHNALAQVLANATMDDIGDVKRIRTLADATLERIVRNVAAAAA